MPPFIDFILFYINLIGYPGIFFVMFLEGLSIPFPGAYCILFARFLVASGILEFWPTLLFGVLGFSLGSLGPFFLSYMLGNRIEF